MSNIIIDIAAQFTGKKAFSDADRAAARLNKSVKNLAATFGVAFSAQAFVNYGKNAVKAFAEDDKAARTLTKTLENLGLAFADADIKTFIADLERQFGVLDDELRPAYQKLISATGDWRKSQELLRLSLDLSAQSGEAVTTTANDLAQALVGNTKGLKKYNLGLTNAQLAALSFEEVLVRLTKISKGQAALAADTYSGKLNKLKVAAANAQEVLGGAFLDSFIKLSGGDVDKASARIESFSTKVAKLTRLLTGADSLSEALNSVDYKFGFIPTDRKVSTNRSASPAGTYLRNQAEIKAAAAAAKLAREQAAAQKALIKSQQDAFKLTKAKSIFDLQKIQIEAALKGKISEEDRIRLKLMKAIEDENADAIDKLLEQLKTAQTKTAELQNLLTDIKTLEVKDPFGSWSIDPITESINALTTSLGGVKTAIQANGTEWSSLATTVAETVIQPNLKEWTSSFSTAVTAVKTATADSIASTQLTASEATTAAVTATNAALLSIAESGNATSNAIISTAGSATNALKKLHEDAASSLSNSSDTITAQFKAKSAESLEALKIRLAAEAAAWTEAAAAAQAAAEALVASGENEYATRNAVVAAAAAAQAAAVAAAAAAAADAAANANSNSNNGSVTVVVEGSVITENDLATIVNNAINGSSWAGNAIGYARAAEIMTAE